MVVSTIVTSKLFIEFRVGLPWKGKKGPGWVNFNKLGPSFWGEGGGGRGTSRKRPLTVRAEGQTKGKRGLSRVQTNQLQGNNA